jgi:hypothetical protein
VASLAAALALAACELSREPADVETSEPEGSFRTETSGVIGTSGPPLNPKVIITPVPVDDDEDDVAGTCGDGRVGSGEACDVALHDCCRSDCTGALPAEVLCRAQDGECDAEERCDGSAFTCPDDALAGTDRECRAQAGDCDAAEFCDGASDECPEDVPASAGTICREPVETCDRFAACDGASRVCPPFTMSVAPVNTPCRASAGACDVVEVCDGIAPTCPIDQLASAGVECRAAAGDCDVAESCSGGSAACPPDAVLAANTVCRTSQGDCDLAETCDGARGVCPDDAFRTAGYVCRAVAGDCDVAETCSGASAACPADAVLAARTVCRIATGDCDLAETCNGTSGACPGDIFRAGGTECRAATGGCDIAESCSGQSAACPVNAVHARGTVCGPAAFECDAIETCPGPGPAGNLCPPDAVADGIACHAGAGTCSAGTCCPGATRDAGQGCELPNGDHLVFVTSSDFTGGAVSGVTRADQRCDVIAAAANLAGTFTAWLSNDPQGRVPANAVMRIAEAAYARVDGVRVAVSRADLDRSLAAPIQLTEWGQSRSVPVWTGTDTSGFGIVSGTCGDWLDPAARGWLGRSGVLDPGWTTFEALNCDVPAALYCFQDGPSAVPVPGVTVSPP